MITQGKWKAKLYTLRDSNNVRWVESEDGKQSICQTFKPNAEDNAHLIAAAPELLAACKIGLLHAVASNSCRVPDCNVCKKRSEDIVAIKRAIAAAENKV